MARIAGASVMQGRGVASWPVELGTDTTGLLPYEQLSPPVESAQFNQQQALNFVIENRTSDPASPVDGQIWLRTDL